MKKEKPPKFLVHIYSVITPGTVLGSMPFDSAPAAMELAAMALRSGWIVSIEQVAGKRPYTRRKGVKVGRPKGSKNKKKA